VQPENFLLDGIAVDGRTNFPRVALADFGLSLPFNGSAPVASALYTLWWRPPEVLLGDNRATFAAEVWACGCILYELLALKVRFEDEPAIR
jgi:serine/threonine protein kinase